MKKVKPKTLRRFYIGMTHEGIEELRFGGRRKRTALRYGVPTGPARRWKMSTERELRDYLSGRPRFFSAPVDLRRLPPFARAVLRAVIRIPYGEVRSYRWLAQRWGKPKASRAVGNALARNPIPILIPCHRVVRSDGSLGGYALGLSWKKKLLELERCRARGKRSGR